MTRFFRATLALVTLAMLAACAEPGPPINIRSGIGQAADLDALRPPSGVTYRYKMEVNGAPVPAEMQLRSRRINATTYDYNGSFVLTLPEVDDLNEIKELVARSFEVRDIKVRIWGNSIIIPVTLRTDNRFRSKSSSLALTRSRYAPHDCFAVIGTCRYTVTEGRRSVALISETTEKDGVWRAKTKADPRKKRAGQPSQTGQATYSIDQNGVLVDMVLTNIRNGERTTMVIRRK